MTSTQNSTRLWCIVASIAWMVLSLHPSAKAQNVSEDTQRINSTLSYFLDNYKVSLDVSGLPNALHISSTQVEWGLSGGYYIFKYDRIQKGVLRGGQHPGKKVLVNAGKSLISVDMGIKYEKRWIGETFNRAKQIEERLLSVPIMIQLAEPDYFFYGVYYTYLGGYKLKFLLDSYKSVEQKEPQQISLPSNGKRFFHSYFFGGRFLTPFGLYLAVNFEFPLNALNNLKSYDSSSNESDFWSNSGNFYVRLGLDITMFLREFYGMSFREGPLIMDSSSILPYQP